MNLDQAKHWIAAGKSVTGFTGAGISTESGIPDFRSPNGVWSRNRTVYFQEFMNNETDRIEYWRQKVESWPAMRDASPNPGHIAFVKLAREHKLIALITQNIDGLHQRSGLKADLVLELHGTTSKVTCLTCRDDISMDEAFERISQGELAPKCRLCRGLLKPATISFGQTLPMNVLHESRQAAQTCTVFLSVGSSLVVEPAASLPLLAKQAGAKLIIVNQSKTPLDRFADFVFRDNISQVLPQLVGI